MNILIIDDYEILRKGIEERVASVFNNANCFFVDNLRGIIPFLREQKIDLILCDLEFKNDIDNTGFLVAKKVLKVQSHIKIIAHTNYNSYRIMNKAIKSGFHSFLHKGATLNEFSNVLTNVLNKEGIYESKTMKRLRKKRKQFLLSFFADSLYGVSSLSKREIYLLLLTKETTNKKELAKIMNVLPSTIDTYYKRIIEKLALKDRKEITMFASEFYDEILKYN